MNTLIDKIRDILGTPLFFSDTLADWDYGAIIEYGFAGILLIIVIVFSFKFLLRLIDRI